MNLGFLANSELEVGTPIVSFSLHLRAIDQRDSLVDPRGSHLYILSDIDGRRDPRKREPYNHLIPLHRLLPMMVSRFVLLLTYDLWPSGV